ncbi:cytochrome b/b6 domain-containing protein [Salinispirillum marinum]|uniref:Cytochrome b/b6 domain-containing protein n=2 Tax=Saccharospirillaceae TaxID=255527 RepID=A0ABV8B9M2_9GAMM
MSNTQQPMVNVWDLPVRVVHWAMVVTFVVLMVSVNTGLLRLHFYAGYTLTALLVFRLLWALVGTTYARFSGFNFSLRGLHVQCRAMIKREPLPYLGHNPAGSIMVVLLWTVLLAQGLSGLLYSDDVFWFGPLSMNAPDWALNVASTLHPRLPPLIMLLIVTHIAAVLYHQFALREPIVKAMVRGQKPGTDKSLARSQVSVLWLLFSVIPAIGWWLWLFALPI